MDEAPPPPDDDPVVRQIPVYLSQQLSGDLYLLQYPLRPHYRGAEVPLSARLRRENGLLELQAEAAPQGGVSRHHKLVSTKLPPMAHYAIGVLRDGCLHVTPLNATLQVGRLEVGVRSGPVGLFGRRARARLAAAAAGNERRGLNT